MIAIDLVQSTAETLMKKAAIEIPDDYLNGLKAAAAQRMVIYPVSFLTPC